MRHTHQREIDGTWWTVSEFSATEGLRLLTRLTNLCGGPLSKAIQALPKDQSIMDAELNVELLGAAVAELSVRLDEAGTVELIRRLLSGTRADDREVVPQFDVLFQGRYLTLFKVLGFVLESNFKIPLAGWLAAESAGSGEPEKRIAAAK